MGVRKKAADSADQSSDTETNDSEHTIVVPNEPFRRLTRKQFLGPGRPLSDPSTRLEISAPTESLAFQEQHTKGRLSLNEKSAMTTVQLRLSLDDEHIAGLGLAAGIGLVQLHARKARHQHASPVGVLWPCQADLAIEVAHVLVHIEAGCAAAAIGETQPTVAPVEVINLLHVDDSQHRRTAANRVPEAVIDLCTPIRGNIPIATIDSDDYAIATPTSRRRSYASSSTPTTACTTSDVVASVVSPPKRKRNDRNESSDEGYECPVCLECVRPREPTSTKCGHVFCRQCIETAIRATHKCPMCKKRLSIRQVTRIYL